MFGSRFVPRLTRSRLTSHAMERETGFEPATNSLEGCDSTPELLPLRTANRNARLFDHHHHLPITIRLLFMRFRLPFFGGQGRIRTSVARSAADLQSAAINHSATCPSSKESNDPARARRFWSRRWDSNPQPSDYKSDALPLSYAGASAGLQRADPSPTGANREV